ncbi:MAG: hypothetical protein OXN84_09875 [Albidovulum sp.]|nr:hypothetical protein [Albidovulum sp.]MDE0531033.1 hypothetical protein [Albidovulum sp.]
MAEAFGESVKKQKNRLLMHSPYFVRYNLRRIYESLRVATERGYCRPRQCME